MTDEFDHEEEQALTGEYVLGLLTDEEAAAYEEVLAVDPGLRAEYAFWAERIAALADQLPQVIPPERVFAAIKADLFGPETKGDTTARRGWLERLGLIPAMLGGVAAAALVLWVLNVYIPPTSSDLDPQAPALQAQIAAEDDSLIVQAAFDATAGTLRLTRTAGTPPPEDRVRELWLIADDTPPVSLGLLSDTAESTLPVEPALATALPGGTLAISDEPAGGSPTGSPTGDVLALGEVASTG
ncbi:hypothetical protein EU805_08765 [Salipiger sp. IMCC34102]|uniref:anti-sigma factor n=1 Tax=Salipiger sp. IMCC34102 TaxID=2510647 RepID=UPI00101BDA22|nr:anti-sigma factor [Salipiger sp. IMCC34102]RYH02700.1 hypothetical protein EU805_08765 [Salipiger sp. IMCC34102]